MILISRNNIRFSVFLYQYIILLHRSFDIFQEGESQDPKDRLDLPLSSG